MICYSYLTPKALGVLLTTGKLSASNSDIIKEFKDAYKWMINQMKLRIKDDFKPGRKYPIWVWYKWEGKYKAPRPDKYRNISGGIYRVTLNIPDEKVLLSNFDTWHAVLSNFYLATTEGELDKDWSTEEIQNSWNKVFDINDVSLNNMWGPDVLSIQGTVWQVTSDMILKVEHFPPIQKRK